MTFQTINNGTVAGDGTGEVLFTAFEKVNSNFTDAQTQIDTKASSASLAASGGANLSGFSASNSTSGTVARALVDRGICVTDAPFNADPTGTTDSGPAFRAAAAYLSSIGGGTLYTPPGLYRCASTETTAWPTSQYPVFVLPSNSKWIGGKGVKFWLDGATLHSQTAPVNFSSGLRFDFVSTEFKGSDCLIDGIEFTTNGWVLDISFRSCTVTLGADNSTVQNCSFVNVPGRNMIVSGEDNSSYPSDSYQPINTKVLNCVFENGSKNVPGNTLASDCSFIYLNSLDGEIAGNRIYNDAAPVTNCGGFELHSNNINVHDNYIANCYPGAYVGWQTATSAYAYGNKIHDNTFESCVIGVSFVDKCDDLAISNNTFRNCLTAQAAYGTAFGNGIIVSTLNSTTGASQGVLANVSIEENRFVEDTAQGGGIGLSLASLQNATISNNVFDGAGSPILLLGASDTVMSNVSVRGNIVREMSPSNPSYAQGFVTIGVNAYAATLTDVDVTGNLIALPASYANQYVAVSATTSHTYNRIRVYGNTAYNVNDAVAGVSASSIYYSGQTPTTYNPTWTQSSGTQPSIGNGILTGTYQIDGNICKVTFHWKAGSTTTFGNSATAWDFSLPFPAAEDTDANGIISDNSTATAAVSVSIGSGFSYFSMGVNGQSVRLNFPYTSAANEEIIAQFSYPITVN